MKAFIAAMITLSLLVGGVILATVAGTEKLDGYLDALPSEGAKLPEAARVLGELGDRVEEEDRLLLCSLYHHEKIDALASAVRRAEAAPKPRTMPNIASFAVSLKASSRI